MKKLNILGIKLDWILLSAVVLISFIGLIVIYSLTLGTDGQIGLLLKKQILFFVVGLIAFFVFSIISYRAYYSYSFYLYLLGLFSLIAVIFLGNVIRGTKGWFDLGFFSIQPVEFVKIIGAIFLAKYFSLKARQLKDLRYLILSAIGIFVFIILILLQPDFGSAMIFFALWFISLLLVGLKKSHLVLMLAIFVLMSVFSWFFLFKDYQKDRILSFVHPEESRQYNVTQAIIAIGSGQFWGKGLGAGSQSHLKFLPEHQTDFIFAALSEELGMVGASIVFILYILFLVRIVMIALKTEDNFGRFLAVMIGIIFFSQILINLGMNLGLLPVTGLPLPFLSYGGSSMLSCFIMAGILESIYRYGY